MLSSCYWVVVLLPLWQSTVYWYYVMQQPIWKTTSILIFLDLECGNSKPERTAKPWRWYRLERLHSERCGSSYAKTSSTTYRTCNTIRRVRSLQDLLIPYQEEAAAQKLPRRFLFRSYQKQIAFLPSFYRYSLPLLLHIFAVLVFNPDLESMTSRRLVSMFRPKLRSHSKVGDEYTEEEI